MSPDRGSSRLVAMQVNAALARRRIVERTEPSTGEAVFAPPPIPQCLHVPPCGIERVEGSNHRDNVQRGLRDDARDGRRSDVMDGKQFLAQGHSKPLGFRRNSACPKPVMWLQFDGNGRRHCWRLAYAVSPK